MTEPRRPLLGIDLGTTYSLVGVLEQGKPRLLPNALGELLTPSAVSVAEDGRLLVGAAARARAATHPRRTATAFKRDMGTDRRYDLGGQIFTPQELSACVLGQLKADAEAVLGTTFDAAVITVPAYFDDLQRQATRAAGEIAGLRVERILNEPTAAAIAYGLEQRARELKAVVLDLGGGTFDVTVLEIMEGVVEIRSTAGDARLGGEDFVDALAELAGEQLVVANAGGVDPRRDAVGWARLREACEGAKRALSSELEVELRLPGWELGDGGRRDLATTLTRQAAEERWQGLLGRLRQPVLRALRDASLAPGQVDEVLLVGGATRMPCVQRLAAELFGREPLTVLPPDEAVALGATLQAGLVAADAALEDLVVTDVAPFSLGIATMVSFGKHMVEGVFTPIIDRGTVIPTSRVSSFSTTTDGQTTIVIQVFQGENASCVDNRKLGSYRVKGIPPAPAGEQSVEVRFTYDLDGVLEVETTVSATGKTAVLVLEQTPGRLTAAELAAARERMSKLKFDPRQALPNTAAIARAEAIYRELVGPARERLGAVLSHFRAVLESQDPAAIDEARGYLNQLIATYR
jgi:molecular chaperone HscC